MIANILKLYLYKYFFEVCVIVIHYFSIQVSIFNVLQKKNIFISVFEYF